MSYPYNVDSPPPRPSRSYFFLLTIPLATASWVISLVSQSIVTSQLGNAFVGPLWFAIILQLLILLLLIYALLSTTLPSYHATLNTFCTLTIVFAVLGVDRNVFDPFIPAQKALSAGWLVLAIIDSLWAIYLTLAPNHDHPVSRALEYNVAPVQFRLRPTQKPQQQQGEEEADEEPRSIPSVRTNIDAFPSPRTITSVSGHHSHNSNVPVPSRPHTAYGRTSNGGRTTTVSAAMSDPRASARTDTHAASEPSNSIRTASMKEPVSVPASPVDNAVGGAGGPAGDAGGAGVPAGPDPAVGAGAGAGASEPPGTGRTASDDDKLHNMPEKKQRTFAWRAEALYKYDAHDADPKELSFKKGEILEISDKSGKWWEGRRADGRIPFLAPRACPPFLVCPLPPLDSRF
ncbi:hypothetical protein C0995_016581 [Termitomyces sp. Mi166|nr:hypothetical protein C0995_016581 [Termitomyces sp. Mi166\